MCPHPRVFHVSKTLKLFILLVNNNNTYIGLNDTANPPDQICSLEEVCGFGGFHDHDPNQWFRCAQYSTPFYYLGRLISLQIHHTHLSTRGNNSYSAEHDCTDDTVRSD